MIYEAAGDTRLRIVTIGPPTRPAQFCAILQHDSFDGFDLAAAHPIDGCPDYLVEGLATS
jgi:hypothetical protein